jgi:hypothetical protein
MWLLPKKIKLSKLWKWVIALISSIALSTGALFGGAYLFDKAKENAQTIPPAVEDSIDDSIEGEDVSSEGAEEGAGSEDSTLPEDDSTSGDVVVDPEVPGDSIEGSDEEGSDDVVTPPADSSDDVDAPDDSTDQIVPDEGSEDDNSSDEVVVPETPNEGGDDVTTEEPTDQPTEPEVPETPEEPIEPELVDSEVKLITEGATTLENLKIQVTEVNAEGSSYAVRADGDGVEVTINGGTYDAGAGSLYNITVWAHHNAKVVINDGSFKTGADVNGEANHVIYAAGGSIIEINGGFFESTVDAPMMINCQDNNGTIVIKGGTFVNFNPADCVSEGAGTNFVAEGYTVVTEAQENGDVWYTVVPVTAE